jgi:hypothetical protein
MGFSTEHPNKEPVDWEPTTLGLFASTCEITDGAGCELWRYIEELRDDEIDMCARKVVRGDRGSPGVI